MTIQTSDIVLCLFKTRLNRISVVTSAGLQERGVFRSQPWAQSRTCRVCQGWLPSLTLQQRNLSSNKYALCPSLISAMSINYTGQPLMNRRPMQTMYRIKDPKRSLDFYTRIIGMR